MKAYTPPLTLWENILFFFGIYKLTNSGLIDLGDGDAISIEDWINYIPTYKE